MRKKQAIKSLNLLISQTEKCEYNTVSHISDIMSILKEIGDAELEEFNSEIFKYGRDKKVILGELKSILNRIEISGMPTKKTTNFLYIISNEVIIASITLLISASFYFGRYLSNQNENKLELENKELTKSIDKLNKDLLFFRERSSKTDSSEYKN